MTRALLFLLAAFWLVPAYADYAPSTPWVFGGQGNTPRFYDNDPATACAKWAVGTVGAGYTCKNVIPNGQNYQGNLTNPDGSYNYTVQAVRKPVCDQGGTLNNAGTLCIAPEACANNDTKNPFIRSFSYSTQSSGVLPVDDGTCKITGVTLLKCYTNAAGVKYCYFQYYQTTSKKDSTSPPLPSPAPSTTASPTPVQSTDKASPSPALPADLQGNCPAGTVQAGVDPSGIPKCIGTGTAPRNPDSAPPTTTKPPTTTSNPDGSSVTKQDVVQTNSDGSTTTTTTTTTKAADGTTSVSVSAVTSNTPTGSAGRQDTPSTDQQDLCKQNPDLTICKNSSVSGTCGDISCTGDAIQCSTLRATAQMQCQQKKNEDDMKASNAYALGNSVLAGTDPIAGTLPSPSKADVVTVANPDTTGWLGAGSYFKDKTIALPDGKTLVLPLSKAADVMIALRYVTMIVCSLVCFKIVRGTFASSSGV